MLHGEERREQGERDLFIPSQSIRRGWLNSPCVCILTGSWGSGWGAMPSRKRWCSAGTCAKDFEVGVMGEKQAEFGMMGGKV